QDAAPRPADRAEHLPVHVLAVREDRGRGARDLHVRGGGTGERRLGRVAALADRVGGDEHARDGDRRRDGDHERTGEQTAGGAQGGVGGQVHGLTVAGAPPGATGGRARRG